MTAHARTGSGFVGQSVPRVEDARVLTGRGRYVDDVCFPEQLDAAFLRSPLPHARVISVDAGRARELPGVVAVLTGEDLADALTLMPPGGASPLLANPDVLMPNFPVLATQKVRFVGEPVAMVIAESRYLAEDGCDAIDVEYEPLEPVANMEQALDPARALLFEEFQTNVITHGRHEYGDPDAAFARAHRVVRHTVQSHRVSHAPMETRGVVAFYDRGRDELTFYGSTQSAHRTRLDIANVLGFPVERIRVVMTDVGGSFGGKGCTCREDVAVCHAARLLGRPVKWMEDRRESLLSSPHARQETMELAAAVDENGVIIALDATVTLDQGAYPVMAMSLPNMILGAVRTLLPGCNRIRDMRWEHRIVATNKAGYTTYRGPWAIEALTRETLTDLIALELELDPVEVRRRNLIPLDEQPYEMITGPTIQCMDSLGALERASESVGDLRELREQARQEGRLVGIGFASFIEPAPGGAAQARSQGLGFIPERATAQIEPNGHITVFSQQNGQGQSHETTLAQVAADEFGVPFEHVRIVCGDSASAPFGMIGTGASRGALMATGSTKLATRALRQKVLEIGGRLLEISPDDLDIVDGMVAPKGAPDRAIPLVQVAMMAYMAAPPGEEPGLRTTEVFALDRGAFAGGTHVCMVEIDRDTGKITIPHYRVYEQCGQVINPAVVDGQIRGAVAQGIGVVLLEDALYDEDAVFVAGTFMDYLMPTAGEVPEITIEHIEGDLIDEFDFRGVGEGGTVAAPPAIVNAVADALGGHPPGGWVLPLTPSRVVELIDAAG